MSDKKNDEKLRILQERLAQIKQKQDTPIPVRVERETVIEIATPKNKAQKKEEKPLNTSWIKKTLIVGSVSTVLVGSLAFGIFYGYKNIDFNSLIPNFSSEKISQELVPPQLEYKLNLKGNNIAIITSYEDESSAKAEVIDLKVKGFKADYFFLPSKSNSKTEVWKVFIGPYESENETNQWIQNIDRKVEIVDLSNGMVIKEIKSKKLIAIEKAEQEKIAIEKAEQEKIVIEKAEQEKIAIEKAEYEKIAIEKAEQEKIAKEKTEQEKIAKEEAEQEKIENDYNRKEQSQLTEAVEEQKRFQLEKQEFENEKNQLKTAREQLEKDKKSLLVKKTQNKTKIIISYTYVFNTTMKDEGILIIKNNANYPIIKQNFANIISQGGIKKIINKAEYNLNTYGENIDGVYFEKSGTIVPIYNGKITEVSL